MQNLIEVPGNNQVRMDPNSIDYFEAKIAASGKPRNHPDNSHYLKLIEELKSAKMLLG